MTTASIVTYNNDRTEVETVLKCVVDSSIEKIYLVDNSPTDELRSFVDFSPKVDYIFGHGNVGYGTAHNIAIRKSIEAGATYHVVINPDIYFKQGTIEALTQYMDNNPDVGQVMPKVVYPNGELQYLCKLLPSPIDLIGRRFIPCKKWREKRNYYFEMRHRDYNKKMLVPFLSGCFMFLRVGVLLKIGGFDDRFFMYCEDIDLCRRISDGGFMTLYYPEVTICHAHKKESFKSNSMLIAHIKSAITYFNKWGWILDSKRRYYNKRLISKLN